MNVLGLCEKQKITSPFLTCNAGKYVAECHIQDAVSPKYPVSSWVCINCRNRFTKVGVGGCCGSQTEVQRLLRLCCAVESGLQRLKASGLLGAVRTHSWRGNWLKREERLELKPRSHSSLWSSLGEWSAAPLGPWQEASLHVSFQGALGNPRALALSHSTTHRAGTLHTFPLCRADTLHTFPLCCSSAVRAWAKPARLETSIHRLPGLQQSQLSALWTLELASSPLRLPADGSGETKQAWVTASSTQKFDPTLGWSKRRVSLTLAKKCNAPCQMTRLENLQIYLRPSPWSLPQVLIGQTCFFQLCFWFYLRIRVSKRRLKPFCEPATGAKSPNPTW